MPFIVPRTHRIPVNLLGMAFGIAGLTTAWHVAAGFHLAPAWVSNALAIIGTCVWLVSLVIYLRYATSSRSALLDDLRDPTFGPLTSLTFITPLLLVTDGITPYSRGLAKILVDVLVVLVVLLGSWLTGFWMRGGFEFEKLHPGYFLPTVAGGLIASASTAQVGQMRLAEILLGLGLICWMIFGSMIMARLIFKPRLPTPLIPLMAIEVAPSAVASLAYFSINGGRIDIVVSIIAGYGVLMALSQIPLAPLYAKLSFSLGTWSFTFSWSTVASSLIYWISLEHPAGAKALSYLVLAAISVLIGGVAARTVLALIRGNLLPRPAA